MPFFNDASLPSAECAGDPELGVGWYFEHAATGEWIGPFETHEQAYIAERDHYETREPMPVYAVEIMG